MIFRERFFSFFFVRAHENRFCKTAVNLIFFFFLNKVKDPELNNKIKSNDSV